MTIAPKSTSVQRPATAELLEDRQLLSVAINPAGFTVASASADTRIIYVDSSKGSDVNSGLSTAVPVKTLAKAASLLRDGKPDWMLLSRGRTWYEALPSWTRSGRSAAEPMLIGSYGSGDRPTLRTGKSHGFVAGTSSAANYLLVQNIQFYSSQRDPASRDFNLGAAGNPYGFFLLCRSNGVLVENCSFRDYAQNIYVQSTSGPVTNVTFRRCQILDAYAVGAHGEGLYANSINGLTIDQCVFDHNGWNEKVAGAGQTGYNHNIYCTSSALGITIRNSVIANGSNCGILARSGGTITDNLLLNNAVGISYGCGNGATSTAGGVHGTISGNVFCDTKGIGAQTYGGGLEIGNVSSAGLLVSNNIFTRDNQQARPAILLTYAGGTNNPADCVGLNNITIDGNVIHGWSRGLQISSGIIDGGAGITGLRNLVVRNNSFDFNSVYAVSLLNKFSSSQEHWSGNRYNGCAAKMGNFTLSAAAWKATVEPSLLLSPSVFADSSRTIETYSAAQAKPATLAGFVDEVRQQSGDKWRTNYNAGAVIAYVRKGFGK